MIKEACIETYDESLYALSQGIDQLEVCSHMEYDGLTPDIKLLEKLIAYTDIPLKVMIRNRKGDFFYNKDDISVMKNSIEEIKKYPIHGFVFGALIQDSDGNICIDIETTIEVCSVAYPIPVTFHKAIDLCTHIVEEAIQLKTIPNIKYILSSGGKPTAEKGAKTLIHIQETVKPEIYVIAAGKVTAENLEYIHSITGLKYFHGRKIV